MDLNSNLKLRRSRALLKSYLSEMSQTALTCPGIPLTCLISLPCYLCFRWCCGSPPCCQGCC